MDIFKAAIDMHLRLHELLAKSHALLSVVPEIVVPLSSFHSASECCHAEEFSEPILQWF